MEEQEQIRELLAGQARPLKHIEALLQRLKQLVILVEKSYQQFCEKEPMCMGSSCCRIPTS